MRIRVRYFALLRDQRGLDEETVDTHADSPDRLYRELARTHGFSLDPSQVKAAINGAFVGADSELHEGDDVVFVPPVAGG